MEKFSVHYIVSDVDAAIAFYVDHLGFKVDMHPAPSFAALSKGALQLFLNSPGTGGAGQAVEGETPRPGGWNRFRMELENLDAKVDQLRQVGCHLRGDIIAGRGGKQALLEDPSGNLIELFEAGK